MSVLRRIAIVRHAKSDQLPGLTDHARPLSDRGRREAPEVARQLRAMGWAPRVVLCSDAARTRETWACMEPELVIPSSGGGASGGSGHVGPVHVEYLRSLYHEGRASAVEALATLLDDERADRGRGVVYLVGHNPGWSDLVSDVTGEPTEMKTANAALLEATAGSYAEALAGRMKLVRFVTP